MHWPFSVSSSDAMSLADLRRLPIHRTADGSGVGVSHDGWPGGHTSVHVHHATGPKPIYTHPHAHVYGFTHTCTHINRHMCRCIQRYTQTSMLFLSHHSHARSGGVVHCRKTRIQVHRSARSGLALTGDPGERGRWWCGWMEGEMARAVW